MLVLNLDSMNFMVPPCRSFIKVLVCLLEYYLAICVPSLGKFKLKQSKLYVAVY